MKNIIKTVSLLTVVSLIPAAFAATSRVGVVNNASPRLPSIAGRIVNSVTTTSSTSTAYYGDSDCIEKYTDCIKADDVCGSDFQECTTNVLFHGQMSKCLSTLYQCSSSGINALFGTSAINALSNVATTATVDGVQEVTRYTYPTDGSVLGQLIIGAKITNQLTTEQCVRRYTNCLKRDDICGEDFELCTDSRAFKKQAMLCDSTLQRCQNDGKIQLFGSVANAGALKYAADSRIGQMIDEGSALAALNAVKTCQKVTDNCLVNACMKNPLSCVEGTSLATIATADIVSGGLEKMQTVAVNDEMFSGTTTASDVRKLLKTQCLETIGANKYCHMTYLEKTPSNRDLADPDLMEEVFSLAYSARQSYANTKITEEVKKFDTNAKDKCYETIKSCAMRSCGGGIGSVCYKLAGNGTSGVHVNGDATYKDIAAGCGAIVNADAYCMYAATSTGANGYQYAYTNDDTFKILFPEYNAGAENDVIGAVSKLNALLATSYNDAAIEDMKKQCQTVALSCVKSMCGTDYVNCYRNRTDIVSGSYDTGNGKLDRSMNKMGGVLDYNIVMGLCMNTVKNTPVCDEHLKVATASWRNSAADVDSWDNNNTVRDAWLGANTTKASVIANESDVIIGCRAQNSATANVVNMVRDIDCTGTMEPLNGKCVGVVDEDGCIYSEPVYMSQTEYVLENGAKTLFQQLLADVEKEAQAKYNAKLTKEQNVCLANNNGGIMGSTDNGSTFMWVKLKSNKVPKNYANKGLETKQFVASNDLYGSFCRAKITVLSDDKDIQEMLGDKATAYFAIGDSFTCGSWINDADLRKISDMVGERELCKQGYGKWVNGKCDGSKTSTKEKIAYAWGTVAPMLAGGAVGVGLTESGVIGGLLNKANIKNGSAASQEQNKRICKAYADQAINKAGEVKSSTEADKVAATDAATAARNAQDACKRILVSENSNLCNVTIPGDDDITMENATTKAQAIVSAANSIKSACEIADNTVKPSNNTATRIAVPIATAVAGGALGAGITASVIKQKKENIQNAAAQQWMDEVGNHIQCYLGADELGTYGDVVSIELD